jgi:hypothetical protein
MSPTNFSFYPASDLGRLLYDPNICVVIFAMYQDKVKTGKKRK